LGTIISIYDVSQLEAMPKHKPYGFIVASRKILNGNWTKCESPFDLNCPSLTYSCTNLKINVSTISIIGILIIT
jgi:hypothetical protein